MTAPLSFAVAVQVTEVMHDTAASTAIASFFWTRDQGEYDHLPSSCVHIQHIRLSTLVKSLTDAATTAWAAVCGGASLLCSVI
jgi:hypothetical protein